jgi:outer membrane protein OmpA-like peptidoglycan-associated protein
MTLTRPSAALASLLSVLLAVPTPVLSAATAEAPSAQPAPRAAAPFVELAQKTDDKDKKGKGKPGQKDDKGAKTAKEPKAAKEPVKKPAIMKAPPPEKKSYQERQLESIQKQKQLHQEIKQKQQAEKARQDAARQKQLQDQQAKQNALKKQQEAEKARQDAFKQKKIQEQQSKDKAGQQKLDADKARQDAFKQKQFQEQQAKDKASRQKLDADKARQDAFKQKQFQEQQAKDKAARQKLDEDKARQDAFRQKQLQDQQARNKSRKGVPPERFDKGKMDLEFQKARDAARRQDRDRDGRPGDKERFRDSSAAKFEKLRQERKERDLGSRRLIIEPDKRVIVRRDDRTFIRHDESQRFNRVGRELRRERRKNGALMVVTMGLAGALIYTLQDDHGRVLRRSRKGRDGREYVLYDNSRYYGSHTAFGPDSARDYDAYVDLPPPVVRIPRDEYIVDYERASPEEIYETLNAPPIERLDRSYSLDEVRQSYNLLERMRRVDLDAINFEFGSWDVEADQYPKLERIAQAMQRILERAPDEVFLIEGHTDAVGSDIDNLSLSDRRAESVAVILSEEFGVPPENLTTQGYGEEHLKVLTEEPSRINRRVSVRRITPLLSRESAYDDER